MKTKIQIFLIAGSLLIGACGSDPAVKGIDLEMKATSSLSTINKGGRVRTADNGGRISATGLTFTEVMIGIRELEFETEAEDIAEDSNGENLIEEIEFEGSFQVDLIAGTSKPDFGMGNLQPGLYDEVELELGPVLSDGSTIRIAFTYGAKSVIFTTSEDIDFDIERPAGFQVDANTVMNLLVLLNLDSMFANVDLSTAAAGTDGVIRINATSNSNLYNQILSALDESCDAGEDDNNDNEID